MIHSQLELCDCLEDGIRALSYSKFGLYVPDFDWNKLQKHFGSSPIYDFLMKDEEEPGTEVATTPQDSALSAKQLVFNFLGVDENEFSPDVPFTSYGLDSLSAGRLSQALTPYLNITQLQLLADVCLRDLEKRMEIQLEVESLTDTQDVKRFSWSALNQPGETIVKLVDMDGVPLILLHGGSGNIVAMMPLQERFNSALWAIQTTPETPLDSLENMAAFYFLKIKEARRSGPYRLGGYSASSLLSFEIARLLEANGDQVVQLLQLDHFPTLYISPICQLDEKTLRARQPSWALLEMVVDSMCDCYRRDSASRQQIGVELSKAHMGLEVRDYIKDYYRVFNRMVSMAVEFLFRLSTGNNETSIRSDLEEWIQRIKAPVTVVIASRGIGPSIQEPGWSKLGTQGCPAVKTVTFDNCHFDMFERDDVVHMLETGW